MIWRIADYILDHDWAQLAFFGLWLGLILTSVGLWILWAVLYL